MVTNAELLLRYSFNEIPQSTNTVDVSGNGLSGTFQQAGTADPVPLQTGPGVGGLAGDYAYDGRAAEGMGADSGGVQAGRVRYAGDGFDASFSSLTICCWFKTDSGAISSAARLLQAVGTENISVYETGFLFAE